MTTAEVTSGVWKQAFPNSGLKIVYLKGTGVTNSDYFTVDPLASVKGAYLIASDGTVGTCTFATNVVTVTNAEALTFTGFAWGV
jgi:hypothetical protein